MSFNSGSAAQKGIITHGAFAIVVVVSIAAATVLCTSPASAHISIDMGGTHKSRWEDASSTKEGPCGTPQGPGRVNVYTYEPGETIEIEVVEFISHPGYFRIAFDDDGDDDFVDPRWIAPPLPAGRACPMNGNDQCRPDDEGDFYNNHTVLMDNLDEHQASSQKTYTWRVTLPDVECDNCTLQVIQVMKDPAFGFHGDYNTTTNDDANDVYHQCIDLVLKRSTSDGGISDAGDATNVNSDAGAEPGTTGIGANGTASGDSTTGSTSSSGDGAGVSPGNTAGATGAGPGNAGTNQGTSGTATATMGMDDDGCSLASNEDEDLGSWLLALGTALWLSRRRQCGIRRAL